MNYEELNKRIDENTEKIISNIEKIEHNSTKIDNNTEKIQQNSYALEILKDYKRQNKRLFVILILELIIWVGTLIAFHL